jgi:hypothetical protein
MKKGLKNLISNKGVFEVNAAIKLGLRVLAVAAFLFLILTFPRTPFTDIWKAFPPGLQEQFGYISYYVPVAEIIGLVGMWVTAFIWYIGVKTTLTFVRSQI